MKKTHDGVKAGKPSRAETLGLLLWKDMRHKSSGPFEGRIQGRAPPPSVSALCRKVVIVSESSAGRRLGLSFWT